MSAKEKKTSILWRIAAAYIVIVFIAMTVTGVFILSQLESYNYDSTRNHLKKTAQSITLSVPFGDYEEIDSHKDEIRAIIREWRTGTEYEIFLIDKSLNIIASDNLNLLDSRAIDTLDEFIITGALGGKELDNRGTIQNGEIPVMNMGSPIILADGSVGAALYLRSDLSEIRETMRRSKVMFIEVIVVALVITLLLSLMVAASIARPINDVTKQAEIMAAGDFSRRIGVTSDDEIGRLSQMFNVMCERLDETLSETSREKRKLEAILNNMADAMIVVDTAGYIVHVNPAAYEMLDLPPWSVSDTTFFDDISGGESTNLRYEAIEANLRNGSSRDVVSIGKYIYASSYAYYRSAEGEDQGIIMLFRDITESQKVERMQTDFVANVSHELKTPITTIKSYSETLVDNNIEDPETVKSFLKVIDNEAERMGRLVKDLLLLSRLDWKQDQLKLTETDLSVFISEIIPKVRLTAEGKSQTITPLYNETIPLAVIVDKDRMEQVVLNVLSNAIKYTPEGGHISVDLKVIDGMASIIIEDDGIGMTEEESSRMFERFYRVDKARTRAEGGTGLGMAITKQIVENHKGKISVKSSPGVGTAVTVGLPLSWSRGRRNID